MAIGGNTIVQEDAYSSTESFPIRRRLLAAEAAHRLAIAMLAVSSVASLALFLVRRPLADALAEAAFNGRTVALFNIPVAEPNLSSYQTVLQYQWLARVGIASIVGSLVLLAVVAACYAFRPKLFTLETATRVAIRLGPSVFWCTCALIAILILVKNGYEGSWYPLQKAIDFTADPPYRHRLLFPLVARLLGVLSPSSGPVSLFIATQFLVLLVLFPLTARWCALFGGRRIGMLSSLWLFPLLLLTTTYFTFYDLGIVLFYTLGLYCLATGRIWPYLAVVGVATLNHENILLLILISGVLAKPWRKEARYDWQFVAPQLLLHGLIRATLFALLPESRAASLGTIWINLHFLATSLYDPWVLADTVMIFVWFAIALLGMPFAPPFLRKAVAILPMLIGIALLVGQINEARLFLAFVPVALALLVCWVRAASRS